MVIADLGDAESIATLQDCGRPRRGFDILVNNAGVTRDGLMVRIKDEDWEAVMNVNLMAGFRLSRALLRGMMKRRWGRIIGISSIVAATGNPGQANYAAAKAGMVGFTKSLAQEVANRGITANIVAPGFIETAMTDALDDAQHDKLLASVPAGRAGTPDDIAASVVYRFRGSGLSDRCDHS